MPVPFQGGCLCGAVRYECAAEPEAVYYCHCTACQRASGSAFHTGVRVPTDALTWLKGQPKEYVRPADSGNRVGHGFCDTCGVPLYAYSLARPHLRSLRAGSLDDGSWLQPNYQIWTQNAAPWRHSEAATEQYPGAKGSSE